MMGILLGKIKPHINNSVQLRSCAAPPGLVRDAPSLPLSLAGNPIRDPAQLSRMAIHDFGVAKNSHFRCLMIQFKMVSGYIDPQNSVICLVFPDMIYMTG